MEKSQPHNIEERSKALLLRLTGIREEQSLLSKEAELIQSELRQLFEGSSGKFVTVGGRSEVWEDDEGDWDNYEGDSNLTVEVPWGEYEVIRFVSGSKDTEFCIVINAPGLCDHDKLVIFSYHMSLSQSDPSIAETGIIP